MSTLYSAIYVVVLLLILVGLKVLPRVNTEWAFAPDKVGHFCVGAGVAIGGLVTFHSLLWTLVLVAVVGAGKEIYDWLHPDKHTPSFPDFFYTVVGGAVGCLPIVLFGG